MYKKPLLMGANQQELPEYASPDFSVAVIVSTFDERSYGFVDWHWHEPFQFCVVLKGMMCFQVEHTQHIVPEGDGIFINSQQLHMSKPAGAGPAAYLCVDIDPRVIEGDTGCLIYKKYVLPVIENGGLQAIVLSLSDDKGKEILEALRALHGLYKKQGPGYELEMSICILQLYKTLFFRFNLSNHAIETANIKTDYLKAIFQYIWGKYSNKINLDMIAGHVHLSRSECCRYFKKMTGQSLFEYITLFRIDRSMDLLRNTEMSIANIAQAVGFQSQSYFTECFRKRVDMTPCDYRKAINSGKIILGKNILF